MALAPCPECGKRVSTQAAACPGCGYPLVGDARWPPAQAPAPRRRVRVAAGALVGVACAAAAAVFVARRGGSGDSVTWIAVEGADIAVDGAIVHVRPFEIARSEVTVAQYRACFEAGACTLPDSALPGDPRRCVYGRPGQDDHPVNCVDREQARAFSRWVGGRLPTDAEWTLAARGPEGRTWPWGEEPPDCKRAVMDDGESGCGIDAPSPVCSRPAGHTPQGVCDLAGNVWEWTDDEPGGRRGGAWYAYAEKLRGEARLATTPGTRDDFGGFRPVRDVGGDR